MQKEESTFPTVIAIVGPNASGKSEWAIQLSREFSGEVICADSRQVYLGMDLGTGKVRGKVREDAGKRIVVRGRGFSVFPLCVEGIDHWLLDLVDPRENFTVAEYQALAHQVIADVLSRDRLPFLVGGSGLYIRAVTEGLKIPSVPPDETLRRQMEISGTSEAIRMLLEADPQAGDCVDLSNPRRVIRALEIVRSTGKPIAQIRETSPPFFQTLHLGLSRERKDLVGRIRLRLHERLEMGLVEEVRGLLKLGISPERIEAFGLEYRYVGRFLKGTLSYEEMTEQLFHAICRYARKQMTWFRKYGAVCWCKSLEEARERIRQFLEEKGSDLKI